MFGKKIEISPDMQRFLETVITNNPKYRSLPQNKKDDLMQKLAKDLIWQLEQVLNKNMDELDITIYNSKYSKSPADATEYARKIVPDLDEKNRATLEKFYRKHTK